jgi:hypothetical protein
MSANLKPSWFTTSPTRIGIRSLKTGHHTRTYETHRSLRTDLRFSVNSLEMYGRIRGPQSFDLVFGSTQVITARNPTFNNSRAKSAVSVLHTGKIGVSPSCESFCSRYRRMSSRKRSPKVTCDTPFFIQRVRASLVFSSYNMFEHG